MYDQYTVEKILADAKADPDIIAMLALSEREKELWRTRFPAETGS